MITKLAWRNLWRRKRRTAITAGSVAFGLWLTVSSIGIADYSYQRTINDSARLGFGHVTIQPQGYQEAPSLKKKISETPAIIEKVKSIDGVDFFAQRIAGQAMFASAAKSVGGMFLAIDPNVETEQINLFLKTLDEGTVFESVDGRGAVIGKVMAEKLKLGLGKKLVMTAIDKEGEVVSELLRVKGIFETGVVEVDGSMALLPIGRVQKMLRYGPDEVTMVSVYIHDYRKSAAVKKALSAAFEDKDREVATWRETQPEMASMSDLDRGMNDVFLVLLAMLIAAGVLNTVLMSVLERKQELGMMMAIGMEPTNLTKLILVESMMLSTVGLVAGTLMCIPWMIYLDQVGLDMSSVFGDYSTANVLVDPVLRIVLHETRVIGILIGLFTLTLLAGLYPAISASRIPPVEVIKKVA